MTQTLADAHARDGYVILPGALTAGQVAELRAETLPARHLPAPHRAG